MATKSSNNYTFPTDMNGNEPEECQDSAKPDSKIRARKGSKTSTKKVLSRQEKLDSVKKANRALMKALELMSQRNDSMAHAQSDI